MNKIALLVFISFSVFSATAQHGGKTTDDASWKKEFRGSALKVNDLVHTKLDVKFDYDKAWMYGKAWIKLKPHFYATDSLTLDAKGMEIKEVAIVKGTTTSPLKYRYDNNQLFIKLDKTYKNSDTYTIYINYISKPNELEVHTGSAAITDAKGLYFINPKGEEKDKPTQIWTQGETEANSVWMPTIDKPNQKTTEEIYMTVPTKYVTLSNGLLISQKKNADGTRTDYWKMDLPHAPYLFFMGVGDFAIVKDSYKGKEVSYYVEKKYESVARKIFGNTPEMIKFYETKLGVPFAWAKYSQIVGRDYVSGAMENTTATLHQESAYQNARQLTDGNVWEETIAHELFHQWFGDLVTAESWSNLTVNESFANYSEYLWDEYKYGKDYADDHNYDDMEGYLLSGSDKKDLVRYSYRDKEDMFDAVSYNKGGRILHMLRNYVGDEAFYKSLNLYLTNNKFKTGEAAQLRLAFEEVTGKDLNWFWNQWYYGSGHPKLAIDYVYDDAAGKVQVIVKQIQETGKIFKLPIAIDIYNGSTKTRNNVWIENAADTFTFNYSKHPDLVNVDADKILLAEKEDNKTLENFVHQMKYAPNFLDRKEALEYFAKNESKEIELGLTDKSPSLRRLAISSIGGSKFNKDENIIKSIEKIAGADKDKKTKAEALKFLVQTKDEKYLPLYSKYVNDSSYSVAGAALAGLSMLDPDKSYDLAKKYNTDAKGALSEAISGILMEKGTEADFDLVADAYKEMPAGQNKLDATPAFCEYLEKVNDVNKVKKGIDYIVAFKKLIPSQYSSFIDPAFKGMLDKLGKAKGKEIKDYAEEALSK